MGTVLLMVNWVEEVWLHISSGEAHTPILLMRDGTAWTVGSNGNGQLGNGTIDRMVDSFGDPLNSIVSISAGYKHSVFLRSDGSVWIAYNFYGRRYFH